MRMLNSLPPLNENNFLRFYPTTPVTDLKSTLYGVGMHNGYLLRWNNQKDILPILTRDTLVFYTNFDAGSTALSGLTLAIAEGNTIIPNGTKYNMTVANFGTSGVNKVITLTIPNTNTSNGVHFNIVALNGSSQIVLRSNGFYQMALTEKNINMTHLLEFYNKSSVYEYEWNDFDPQTMSAYKVRVSSSVSDLKYNKDQTVYTSATSGASRITRSTTTKTYSFETNYADERFHDAFNICSSFSFLQVNSKSFICEQYEVTYQPNMNIFKGLANFIDNNYGRRINQCN